MRRMPTQALMHPGGSDTPGIACLSQCMRIAGAPAALYLSIGFYKMAEELKGRWCAFST